LSLIAFAARHNPMAADDGRLWITFNGDYNFLSCAAALEAGHRFRSHTDTEVVPAYSHWGLTASIGWPACLPCLWDGPRRRSAVGDRLGKKPPTMPTPTERCGLPS
jgi:asparagine synthetase B (glutamine-hydrolysing)